MSTAANSYYFRRRTMGRAASPPTWACYEQIRYEDEDYSDSGSESCSEDDDDYSRVIPHRETAVEADGMEKRGVSGTAGDSIDNMDMDDEGDVDQGTQTLPSELQKDVKGKQRAIEPEPESPSPRRQVKKRRQPVYTLRPILTIQRSQGFVWNQDLFVPPYIKDRYVASTSPPNSRGFISTSASSTNSALTDYEVEVVEIRVKEGELYNIIP